MHIFVCDINPTKGLIELFVTIDERYLMYSWMPQKYGVSANYHYGRGDYFSVLLVDGASCPSVSCSLKLPQINCAGIV